MAGLPAAPWPGGGAGSDVGGGLGAGAERERAAGAAGAVPRGPAAPGPRRGGRRRRPAARLPPVGGVRLETLLVEQLRWEAEALQRDPATLQTWTRELPELVCCPRNMQA